MNYLLYFSRKLHSYAGKVLYVNLTGMMLVGLLDGAGILLLVPLLGIIGIVEVSLGAVPGMQWLEHLQSLPTASALLIILGFYILIVTAQGLLQRSLSLRDIRIHTGFINHIRLEIYRSLLQANWDFFIKRRKSDLINSLTTELGRVTNGALLFMQLIASLAFTVIQLGLAFWLSAKVSLFVLCCGLLMMFLSRRFLVRSKALGAVTTELGQSYLAGMTDHFNGIKDIKSNQLEASRYRWLKRWSEQAGQERYAVMKLKTSSQLYYKLFSALMIAAFLLAAVVLFETQGAQLLLIIVIVSRLWPRFMGIQSSMEQISAAIPAFKSLMELQQHSAAAQELLFAQAGAARAEPLRLKQQLECRDVSFSYSPQQSVNTLEKVNLRIPANGMTAIVGRSGAGKSTLIDLLMGLLQPQQGEVLIDGLPLAQEQRQALRQAISYVPQDPFLFHGSLRENLLLIKPDASDEQLWQALEFASAAEFVRQLPQGLGALIGDRGVRLSGGERQRIVLARAILRQPSILVLDEATSALDSENESNIQLALERLKGSMTIIVIAHRLSTIRSSDQVIVLDQGRIVQSGGFAQLAEDKKGLFSSLLGGQIKLAQ